QVRTAQVGVAQVDPREHRGAQVGAAQVRAAQVEVVQGLPGQVAAAQVGFPQDLAPQVLASQVLAAQVTARHCAHSFSLLSWLYPLQALILIADCATVGPCQGVQGGVAAARSGAEGDKLRIPPGAADTRQAWTTTGESRGSRGR